MSRLLLKQYESRIKDLMELGNTREDAVNIAARTAATGAGAASVRKIPRGQHEAIMAGGATRSPCDLSPCVRMHLNTGLARPLFSRQFPSDDWYI